MPFSAKGNNFNQLANSGEKSNGAIRMNTASRLVASNACERASFAGREKPPSDNAVYQELRVHR
jgi:hypothetical protein